MRADAAALHLRVEGGAGADWHLGDLALPEAAELRQMRFDRVYAQGDLPGLADRRRPLRALKCAAGAGVAVLAVQRSGSDFRAVDTARLSGLLPFLGQALAAWQALRRDRARLHLDGRIGACLGGGWMVLSPAGNVLEMAGPTRDWLQGTTLLRLRPNGRLDFRDAEAARRFRQALTLAAAGGAGPLVRLSQDPLVELRLRAETLAGEACLLGLIRHGRAAASLDLDHVAAALDLSRSEARLAILLCDGLSLSEAATTLGWTLETARSCSKQVYARMGVGGQGAVLRRMLSGALWLD